MYNVDLLLIRNNGEIADRVLRSGSLSKWKLNYTIEFAVSREEAELDSTRFISNSILSKCGNVTFGEEIIFLGLYS